MWCSSVSSINHSHYIILYQCICYLKDTNLDLCKCEHVWLKIAQEAGVTIHMTSGAVCGADSWDTLSSDQLMEICDPSTITGNSNM